MFNAKVYPRRIKNGEICDNSVKDFKNSLRDPNDNKNGNKNI